MTREEVQGKADEIVAEVEKAIVGKKDTIQKCVATLLCNGHVLLEDIPGVGKTTLAKAISRAIGGEFRRIQFTPDLLPSDVTGTLFYNQGQSTFEFRPGPVFGNVVLADEINRATPKTQSSLLEAMEERQVTTDGETRGLPKPFFVIATQNNLEMTGTYPLPEAQLDRFFARLSLGYPDRVSEVRVLSERRLGIPLDEVSAIVNPEILMEMQATVREVFVKPSVQEYIVDIVRSTRESAQLLMGASPRGSLHLMRASQARAAMLGTEYVLPDHVKDMAVAVLAHRVIGRAELRAQGISPTQVIQRILETVPTPVPN